MNTIDIDKIIEQSKGLKSYKKFNAESEKLSKLLDKFMMSTDREYNEIFTEWMIVRLVTVFEYHFKSLIISLIDEDGCQYDEEIKISLSDLEKIQRKKSVSAGKIFVNNKSLQNIEIIDKILSNLLKINFIKELKNKYPEYIDLKNMNECLEKRHQIIHEMKKIKISKKQLKKYATYMMLFQIQSSKFCVQKIKEKDTVDQKSITIEIVDDDAELVDLMLQALNLRGYKVVSTALDGKKAVREYQRTRPNIVLMDVAMPNFDGIYALEQIKKKNKNAKIILITGGISKKIVDKALKLKASAVLYKPIDLNTLEEIIEKILMKKQPLVVEKRNMTKKIQEEIMKKNVEIWIKKDQKLVNIEIKPRGSPI